MVTQQLITVPQWNIGEVNYILKVEVYVNNRITTILKEPPRSYISELDNKWIKIFNKYIHCSMKGSQNNIFYDNQNHLGKNKKDIRLIIYDPF
ncbi:MAG: hypothetical protein IIB81_00410 [Nanoarchaeota archaeon]|nr:hypothetical protein [Nanoarchaeota archaeon]